MEHQIIHFTIYFSRTCHSIICSTPKTLSWNNTFENSNYFSWSFVNITTNSFDLSTIFILRKKRTIFTWFFISIRHLLMNFSIIQLIHYFS